MLPYMQANDALVLCKQCFRGAAILVGIASAPPLIQLLAGDVAAWTFLPLTMGVIVMKGRKPG